jgi:hypothetical protein
MYAPNSSATVGACNLLHNDFDYIGHTQGEVRRQRHERNETMVRWALMAGGQEAGDGVVEGVKIIVGLNPGYEARVHARELVS